MVMFNQERMECHFRFKDILERKVNNCRNCLTFLVTVLFIGKEWLSLLMLLKTGLPRQFCSEKLLQIGKTTF